MLFMVLSLDHGILAQLLQGLTLSVFCTVHVLNLNHKWHNFNPLIQNFEQFSYVVNFNDALTYLK